MRIAWKKFYINNDNVNGKKRFSFKKIEKQLPSPLSTKVDGTLR